MSDMRLVSLPEDLCAAAEKKYGQRFNSVQDLLTFVLSDLLQDDEALDRAEEQIVEERLRELGYI